MRQQQVDAVTLPVLMDSPGWPLVRSLVLDMASQEIHKHFDDPRLGAIEEITLLGFAYGGCDLQPAFYDALFNSRGFANLRTLIFHSTESGEELSRKFWASPLARRLERIDGISYFGEPIAGPLAVRELKVASYGGLPDGFSLAPLLDPAVSPRLTTLSLGAYFDGQALLLDVLAREGRFLERIDSVTLHFSDFGGKTVHLLGNATLPRAAGKVTWHTSNFHQVSLIHLRDSCDINTLFDFADETLDLRFNDQVTEYSGLVFDWGLRNQVSRRVTDLALLLPLEIDLAQVLEFCEQLPHLRQLSLIYPFTEAELEVLLGSDTIRRLEALSLFLNIGGGQWTLQRTNEYMKVNESRYKSRLRAAWLFDLAFGERTASIPNLSLFTASFDLARSADRIQHCEIRAVEAAHALAACNPRRPIEVLHFDYDLWVKKSVAAALAKSDLFSRVYRFSCKARVDEAAARILARCRHFRNVRDFQFFFNNNSMDTIQTLLNSPHFGGVWDVNLYLPDPWKVNGIEAVCANTPLLDRAVALELHGPDKSPLIPRSGRLGRVRRLGEWISMHVFGDARLAAVWSEHPVGRPLRARLCQFVERTYRVEHKPEDLPELARKLLSTSPFHDEMAFGLTLRALLATAFDGKPVAEKTRFADLNDQQQNALRTIAQMEADWWNMGSLVRDAIVSYGLLFWDKERLEKYIAGTEESSK
jgi:hypothetical protein